MIDHRQLLAKYMRHVGDCEGSTFVYRVYGPKPDGSHESRDGAVSFIAEEYAELMKIEHEI